MHIQLKVFILFTFVSGQIHAQEPAFQWANEHGSPEDHELGRVISVDSEGYIYIAGDYGDTVDFDPGPGVFELASAEPSKNVFIQKLNQEGELVWAKHFYGSSAHAYDLKIDAVGDILICGGFSNPIDFDPGPDTLEFHTAMSSAYIVKLNSDGNLIWVRTIGGDDNLVGAHSLAIDSEKNILVGGFFNGTTDMDPGPAELIYEGEEETAFILKLSSTGELMWVQDFWGEGGSGTSAVQVNSFGEVFLGLHFELNIDVDPGVGIDFVECIGVYDAMVMKLSSTGSVIWYKKIGNEYDGEEIREIVIDNANDLYITGEFVGEFDFDLGPTEFIVDSDEDNWMFLLKLSNEGEFHWVNALDVINTYGLATDGEDNIVYIGIIHADEDLDPGLEFHSIDIPSSSGAFIINFDVAGSFKWAAALAHNSSIITRGVAIDNEENVFVTGTYHSYALAFPGPDFPVLDNGVYGNRDIFVAKFKQCYPTVLESDVVACDSFYWAQKDITYYSSGVYSDTVKTFYECDTIKILNLTINSSFVDTAFIEMCESYYWPSTDELYLESGFYVDSNATVFGCDSILVLDLTIHPSYAVTETIVACDSLLWINGVTYYEDNFEAEYTLPTVFGCDSVIALHLNINQSNENFESMEVCDSLIWIDGETYYESGVITHSLINEDGCDSIVTLDLTVNTINPTLTFLESSIWVAEEEATYQWVKCPEMSIIEGAIDQSYSPDENGVYAVVITKFGCEKVSECFDINDLSVFDLPSGDEVIIYPNPFSDEFNIKLFEEFDIVDINIIDVQGKVVYSGQFQNVNIIPIRLNVESGLYFVHLFNNGRSQVFPLIKS